MLKIEFFNLLIHISGIIIYHKMKQRENFKVNASYLKLDVAIQKRTDVYAIPYLTPSQYQYWASVIPGVGISTDSELWS